jgi:hypothetical protein
VPSTRHPDAVSLEQPLIGLAEHIGKDLNVWLQAGVLQLLLEKLVHLEQPRRVQHVDRDPDRFRLPLRYLHGVDRGCRDGVNIHVPALEGDATPPLRHVQGVAQPDCARLQRLGVAIAPVVQDGVKRLRHDHSPGHRGIDAAQQLQQLLVCYEEPHLLVVYPVHRHADVVEERCQDDDYLGVGVGQLVVLDDVRRQAARQQYAEDAKGDVHHELHVNGAVVAHPHPVHSVDVLAAPDGVKVLVRVDTGQHLLKHGVLP